MIITTIHIKHQYTFVVDYNLNGSINNIVAGDSNTHQLLYDAKVNKESFINNNYGT